MKKFMRSFTVVFTMSLITFGLVACSGGGGSGGGSTPTQLTSVTVTCPNQTTQTAETTELANAKCAKPILLSAVVAPDFSKVTVITDSVLDHGVITLRVGSLTDIPGTFTMLQTNGFVFTPNQKLQYGVVHDFSADVMDSLGRHLLVNFSFTPTTNITCTLPAILVTGANVCAIPSNIKVTGANQLPVGCNTWASQCWKDAVANGAVKFVSTSDPLVMLAYFRNTTEMFGVSGLWNLLPVSTVDGLILGPDISGGVPQEMDWVVGNIAHLKERGTAVAGCVQYLFDTSHNWISQSVDCPAI